MTTHIKMLVGHKADYSVKWFSIVKGGYIAYRHCDKWIIVDIIKGTR
ncbi:MAG: hypothetical protein LBD84_07635 [Campylobacteraceae bacterium]|jgi:hypothetical protein|nr:hypothetical protein [Campylobacteraceae bacterium]